MSSQESSIRSRPSSRLSGQGIGMHSYVFDKDLILRSVLAIHFNSLELGQNLVSGQNFSEDGIFAV